MLTRARCIFKPFRPLENTLLNNMKVPTEQQKRVSNTCQPLFQNQLLIILTIFL